MNQLESTFDIANSLGILYSLSECTINLKSVPHIHLKSTIRFPESLWIHYLLRGFSRNLLSFGEITMNKFSGIQYQFTICFTNELWIHLESIIIFAISLWIQYLFRNFTITSPSFFENSLSLARLHYEFSLNLLSFSRNHFKFKFLNLFRLFTLNPLSLSRNHYRFTIFFAISIWIHYLIPEITINTLFFCEINLDLFPKSQWKYYLIRKINMNTLSVSRFWIHFLFPDITMNTLFSQNQYKFTISVAISL